ncbi:hypothetical protein AXG93_3902s1060 [Marchantia polymorpha subsp. ruderalis]|uniref:Uncharacterized protein n=1 Tax=Marchantia polymorpha subsp. ruderalis TaxID=1480154 RepID=A0A176WBM9_MARPO|nr:hypothetical protein AXG93_3902s1060 [Marchantia polymorpha subsp. ruderalis]
MQQRKDQPSPRDAAEASEEAAGGGAARRQSPTASGRNRAIELASEWHWTDAVAETWLRLSSRASELSVDEVPALRT